MIALTTGMAVPALLLTSGGIVEWVDGPVFTHCRDMNNQLLFAYLADEDRATGEQRWVYYRPLLSYLNVAVYEGICSPAVLLETAIDHLVFVVDKDRGGTMHRTTVLAVRDLPRAYRPQSGGDFPVNEAWLARLTPKEEA